MSSQEDRMSGQVGIAVVFVEVGASREDRVRALKAGVTEIVHKLIENGCQLDEILCVLEDAESSLRTPSQLSLES
jgi:hypothetical protein